MRSISLPQSTSSSKKDTMTHTTDTVDTPRRVRYDHLFVLLAVLVSVGATVQASSPGFDVSVMACAFALGAGVIYGALEVLCRNAGHAPDVAAVMYYL